MLPTTELTSDPETFEARNYLSLAALVFLILEYFANCLSEYNHIWRARPTTVKYIYLISRYAGIIGQIVNYILIHLFLNNPPVNPERCRVWFIFLFGICAITVASLHTILFLRVYALYRKNVKVHILSLLLILPFVLGSVVMKRATPSMFSSHCDKTTSPIEIGLMGGSVVLSQVALWIATFAKRNVAEGRAVVVQLVICEGAWIILTVIAIIAASVTYAVVYSTDPSAIFVWPNALMSAITCRIILNMNKLRIEVPQNRREFDSTEFRLSTVGLSSSSAYNDS